MSVLFKTRASPNSPEADRTLTEHSDSSYVINKQGVDEVPQRRHGDPAALDQELLDRAEPEALVQ